MEILYDAPAQVDLAGRIGIYWFRVYASEAAAVVVVADLPANPGNSPTNVFSRIVQWVIRFDSLSGRSIRWFIWYPAGRLGPASSFSEAFVSSDASVGWSGADVTRATIEAAIGAPLVPLPPHPETLRRVMELGGRLDPGEDRIRWTVVPRHSLPPAEYPFRCPFREQYREFIQAALDADPSVSRAAAADRFFAQLGAAGLAECPRHDGDWENVARVSVAVVESVGSDSDLAEVLAALASYHLPEVERRWAESLFRDPMWWDESGYANGQHRGCALRLTSMPTVVKPEIVPEAGEPSTWILLEDNQ